MTDMPNGPSQEETEEVVHAIEGYMADLMSEKSLYMSRCKPLHEAIKDVIEDAVKTKNFDKKALKITVKQREYLRKMEKLENELDQVTQTALDRLQNQLGTFSDSPLGKAAMDAAKASAPRPRKKRRDPIDELVGEEDQPPEDAAAAE
jgi:uncharacterized protein (UPF0335 family)